MLAWQNTLKIDRCPTPSCQWTERIPVKMANNRVKSFPPWLGMMWFVGKLVEGCGGKLKFMGGSRHPL